MVVDHDTGRLLWAAAGRDKRTLARFFDLLGEQRSARLRLVSADGADWIADLLLGRRFGDLDELAARRPPVLAEGRVVHHELASSLPPRHC